MEEVEVRKKDILYRGQDIEELKKLDVREFAKYLGSRERRYVLRQFRKVEEFISRAKGKVNSGKQIKTHQRDIVIVPTMVGLRIHIYNGKTFIPINIIGEMIGHKLGEFALTRAKVKHGKTGVGATKGSKHKSKK